MAPKVSATKYRTNLARTKGVARTRTPFVVFASPSLTFGVARTRNTEGERRGTICAEAKYVRTEGECLRPLRSGKPSTCTGAAPVTEGAK